MPDECILPPVFPLLPVEAEHVRGSQSERERQVHPLLGRQLPGSLELSLEAADVLWMWSHLLVGKAKIHRYASESRILGGVLFVCEEKQESTDTRMTVMQITLSRH